jgi:hypothetical protein
MEILAPLIECFNKLLFPFTCSYYIIQNLKKNLLEYLETPSGNIIFGIYKDDYDDLSPIFNIINRSVIKLKKITKNYKNFIKLY